MKTLRIARNLAVGALLAGTLPAAPFLAISENAEVFLTAAAGVRSDTNVYLSSKATRDTIANFDVGAELKFGQRSAANGYFSVTDSFNNFASHSGLNTNLATARFATNYDDGKLRLGLASSYVEANDNQTDTVNGDFLTRRNIFSVGGTAEAGVTEKTSVGGGADFARTTYRRKGFSDSDIVTVPVNLFLVVTPKVDLSLGYRYRNSKVSLGQDSRDDFYNVGARGQFTPKIGGQFSIGLNRRTLAGGSAENSLGISSNFNYSYSAKTGVQLGVSSEPGTTGQGLQQKSLSFTASIQTMLSEEWSLRLGGSHRTVEYATRTDYYTEGQISANYTFSSFLQFAAAYSHRNNDTTFALGAFTGDVLSLSANFRY